MYDYNAGAPGGKALYSEEACKPDYERIYKEMFRELDIIRNFKESFKHFINVVGAGNFVNHRTGVNGAAELLGAVELDIMNREKRMAAIEEKISK